MGDKNIDISIRVQAQLAQLNRAQRELLGLNNRMLQASRQSAELRKNATGLAGALRMGAGIVSMQTLAKAVGRVNRAMRQAVGAGIAFNQTLETAEIGLAGILRQFNPDKFADFTEALAASGEAIDLLAEKAKKSPATFEGLVQAFQGTAGAMSAAGIEIRDQVDLITLMSQTLAGLGISSQQILQESRALVTGNITPDALAAQTLGITAADVRTAREAGNLYEYLVSQMTGFSEAADASSQSLTTLKSNLQDSYQQTAARETEELTEALKELYTAMNGLVSSDEFGDFLHYIASGAERGVDALTDLSGWVQQNAYLLKSMGRAALYVGTALATIKIAKLLAPSAANTVIIGQLLAEGVRTGAIRGFKGFAGSLKSLLIPGFTTLGQLAGAAMVTAITGAIINAAAESWKTAIEAAAETQDSLEKPLLEMRKAANAALTDKDLDRIEAMAERLSQQLLQDARMAKRQEKRDLRDVAAGYQQLVEVIRKRREEIIATNQANEAAARAENQRIQTMQEWRESAGKLAASQERLEEIQFKALSTVDKEVALREKLKTLDGEREKISGRNLASAAKTEEQLKISIAAQQAQLNEVDAKILETELDLAALSNQRKTELQQEATNLGQVYQAKIDNIKDLIRLEEERWNELSGRTDEAAIDERTRVESRRVELIDEANELLAQYREAVKGLGADLPPGFENIVADGLRKAPPQASRFEQTQDSYLGRRTWNERTGEYETDDSGQLVRQGGFGSAQSSYQGAAQGFLGGIMEAQVQMGTLWNNISQGVVDVAQSMQQSIGGALEGLWTKSMGFGQALKSIATGFGDSMLEAISDIAAQWIVQQGLMLAKYVATKTAMFAVDVAFSAKGLALTLANAAKSLVAWIPSAIAASISSFGVAAAIGTAAVVALLAAGGGFATGGYTGDGDKYEVAGPVHKGEYVVPKEAVDATGPEYWAARVNQVKFGYATGGVVGLPPGQGLGSSESTQERPINIVLMDDRDGFEKLRRNPDLDAYVLDLVRANRGAMFS